MPEPIDQSMVIAKLSRFKMDHPDYDGMTNADKRRAIVRLLRRCNFCVTSLRIEGEEIARQRAALPNPRDFVRAKMQAHQSGVVWVRCNNNGGAPKDGLPVAFDPVTGSEVTGCGLLNLEDTYSISYAYGIRSYQDDQIYVVGYAVTDPETVGDHQEIAVQLMRRDSPLLQYGRCLGDTQVSVESSPIEEGDYQSIDEEMLWTVNPSRTLLAWRTMGILAHRWVYEDDTWVFALASIGEARVINPHPFGFKDRWYWVDRQGDNYILYRPRSSSYYPQATLFSEGYQYPTESSPGSGYGAAEAAVPLEIYNTSGTLYVPDGDYKVKSTATNEGIAGGQVKNEHNLAILTGHVYVQSLGLGGGFSGQEDAEDGNTGHLFAVEEKTRDGHGEPHEEPRIFSGSQNNAQTPMLRINPSLAPPSASNRFYGQTIKIKGKAGPVLGNIDAHLNEIGFTIADLRDRTDQLKLWADDDARSFSETAGKISMLTEAVNLLKSLVPGSGSALSLGSSIGRAGPITPLDPGDDPWSTTYPTGHIGSSARMYIGPGGAGLLPSGRDYALTENGNAIREGYRIEHKTDPDESVTDSAEMPPLGGPEIHLCVLTDYIIPFTVLIDPRSDIEMTMDWPQFGIENSLAKGNMITGPGGVITSSGWRYVIQAQVHLLNF